MDLKIEYLNKAELRPYAKNAKIHTAEQVEQIKKSIREFGFNDPIAVWKGNEIIEGHGRLLAAMEMEELDIVPIIRLDGLSDEQRRAYMLVHNKLTMNTDFDDDLLFSELSAILDVDMSVFGFIEEEEDEDKNVPADVPFTEYLDEESNYIVLKFNSKVDWLQLQSIFELQDVVAYSTRNDGKISEKMKRIRKGRIVDGVEFLNRIGAEL